MRNNGLSGLSGVVVVADVAASGPSGEDAPHLTASAEATSSAAQLKRL